MSTAFKFSAKSLNALIAGATLGVTLVAYGTQAQASSQEAITLSCDTAKQVCQASGTDEDGKPIAAWTSWFTKKGSNVAINKKNTQTSTQAKVDPQIEDSVPCDQGGPKGSVFTWHVSTFTETLKYTHPSATVDVYCY